MVMGPDMLCDRRVFDARHTANYIAAHNDAVDQAMTGQERRAETNANARRPG